MKTIIYWGKDNGDLYLAEHLASDDRANVAASFERYEIEHPVTLTLEQMVLGKDGNNMLEVLLQAGKARKL